MCGRYTFEPDESLFTTFGVSKSPEQLPLSLNVSPGTMMPVITSNGQLEMMRWGLIPFWAKDPKIGNRLINARGETLDEKPSFKHSLRSKRCIVPATGFYEWKKANGKIPYHFAPTRGKYLAIAGLFDVWNDPEGKPLKTYTIITTSPNADVAPIHDRMPAILPATDVPHWLAENTPLPVLLQLLQPYQQGLIVSKVDNLSRNSL